MIKIIIAAQIQIQIQNLLERKSFFTQYINNIKHNKRKLSRKI